LSKTVWDQENIAKLLACQTDADYLAAFPDANLETLKRKARSVRSSDEDIPSIETVNKIGEVPALQLTGDQGSITTGEVDAPITDWTDTLAVWGLDPEVFEVVEPVTMKAWDAGTTRKFSYRARIQKKAAPVADLETTMDIAGWRQTLQSLAGNPASSTYGVDSKLSYAILVADPQLGKPGTQEAVANWTTGIDGHLERIRNLLHAGIPVGEIALVFMGDEHEGAVGNYTSQPYEVELSYSKQLELDFDMRTWSIRQLLEAGLPMQIGSVPSNHGEHTRFGSSKVTTSIYDNSSTMIASLVKKVFAGTDVEPMLTWHIAEDEQDVNLDLSGVKANFTHGHIAKGSGAKTGGASSKSAIEKQILGRTGQLYETTLFYSAHYHHFNVIEDRGRSFFGCPALEAEKSSRWFYDSSGVWSKPGMLGMVVGAAAGERGWDELSVI